MSRIPVTLHGTQKEDECITVIPRMIWLNPPAYLPYSLNTWPQWRRPWSPTWSRYGTSGACRRGSLIKKKKIKFSSYIRKFSCSVIYEVGLPNIWGNAQIFHHVYEEAGSHIYDFATASFLNFLIYIWGQFYFLFFQCGGDGGGKRVVVLNSALVSQLQAGLQIRIDLMRSRIRIRIQLFF